MLGRTFTIATSDHLRLVLRFPQSPTTRSFYANMSRVHLGDDATRGHAA